MEDIHWLGHDTFRIEYEGKIIYTDPFQLQNPEKKADIIFVTHEHSDHCSPADIEKIRKESTVIIAARLAAEKLQGQVQIVSPREKIEVGGIEVETVPAYNVNKFRSPGVPFHPEENGGVGYILNIKGARVYHAGDTDVIPEMKEIRADIFLVPVSGIYVMTAAEAVEAAGLIKPAIAVPMHIGRHMGTEDDAVYLKKNAGCEVRILPIEE
ncbi:MAG: MBL fold metallo-hydrolase [Elusimicrobia bacterium]|nr:MBL fold metallo-hydrolase [Elusimicrobiota bacterium]